MFAQLCWINILFSILHSNTFSLKICFTWRLEAGWGAFGPRWRDAHLGRHAPPPWAGLRHLGQRRGLLTAVLVLALRLRGRGGSRGLPSGRAAGGVHACVLLFLHLFQVLSTCPAAAHLLLGMLGPASFLWLQGNGEGRGGHQRKKLGYRNLILHMTCKKYDSHMHSSRLHRWLNKHSTGSTCKDKQSLETPMSTLSLLRGVHTPTHTAVIN